ncbi:hypothetical protein K4L44_01730 [Halosquirtibacter laminarini]|uniref:Uncharacterized protein n=1 Tax=Halosquirtibacter laminarini TaxID=3374600 RepID=A0AC61NNT0_9BACT|nr:hypothetical protein K4L44_01730 [Prolixibacteraceae bacterium]
MKYNAFYYTLFSIGMLFALLSCDEYTKPEAIEVQKKVIKDDIYYENLRAYKRSDHAIAFGWFGGWTCSGASAKNRLSTLPDSVDLVSIWGNWFNLNEAQQEDLNNVRKNKGTKVLMCWICQNVGDQIGAEHFEALPTHEEKIKAYAKAIIDTIDKYGYDGFDIDYEPGYGAKGNITSEENMEIFIKELGKYLGPQSGTDRILVCDGEPYALKAELGKYLNYCICQAYASWGNSDAKLNRYYDKCTYLEEFTPKKIIVTENFESYWQNGGVDFIKDGVKMNSLEGMARWNPVDGRKGGVGTYHMEYEYIHNPDYKYLREAIQIMNPAVK